MRVPAMSVNDPAMSYKAKREELSYLLIVAVCFCAFGGCSCATLRRWEDGLHGPAARSKRFEQGNLWRWPQHQQPPQGAFPGGQQFSAPKLDQFDRNLAQKVLSWSSGNISKGSTGVHGVHGKVLGPAGTSSTQLSDWLAMRPAVQCDDEVMTFTASGGGLAQLLVDRAGASPISPLQLPSYCGYSVRTSWSDLKMMAPYDACYITQENGSYVLPMLWWGSPLKLSCPVQTSTPAPFPSAPAVLCSPHGMAVQLQPQEKGAPMLGAIVNGVWVPFVSATCAQRVNSQPEELIFFIPFSAHCVFIGDGLQLHLSLNQREFILSCPVAHQLPPSSPSGSPGVPQIPNIPEPATPTPTSPPPSSPPPSPLPPPSMPPTTQTQPQMPSFYDYLHYMHSTLRLPQVYPPGPQPALPTRPVPGGAPGHQPHPQQPHPQQSLFPSVPGKFPPEHPSSPKLPDGPPQHPSGLYYHYVPLYYHAGPTVAPPPATQPPKAYYTEPTAAPVTTEPSPPVPSSLPFPPKHPFYSPSSYYYRYWQSFYPEHASPSLPPTTTPLTMIPKQPVGEPVSQYSPPVPISLPVPTPPAAKGPLAPQEHQQLWAQQVPCPSNTDTICSYYPYPYTQYPYQPPHPAVPQYPVTVPPLTITAPTTTSTIAVKGSTQPQPTPQSPHLQCLKRKFVVFLPFAHPDLIQVRDQKTWLFLSDVLPQCGYRTQMSEGSTVILQSPLPACHSQTLTPTSISLPVRFWDASMEQYRILNLQCPYRSTTSTTPTTPTKVTPSVSSTPPSVSKGHIRSSVVPKPKVSCSSHQMTVELPPGPISAVAVKDIKGNRKNLQDAPKHCGYSSSKGKNGKIRLNLQLHTQCHMSVQGKMYTIDVIYMTVSGERQAQFTCPVSISGPAQECNLPSEQRLPCGPGSVSQPHCLSLGCCFSMHRNPACYYPMDECTIDRHFVFSVPASLTEPPLSPSLLVAAGNSTCKPQKVTPDFALFKIPMDGCGARRVAVGKTLIYMVEIINIVQAISLNYGTITRDSPIRYYWRTFHLMVLYSSRLLVECRYTPGTALTVSYMVKTPTVGPAIHTQGVIGVQLLIAKDAQYRSYYPQYHQPLLMLLGKPLYLEVRLLNAPDPSLVLLVHYCVAYPRSGKAVWVLLYNGCPNPLDPAPQQVVLFDPQPPSPQGQTRRFTISTFQFLSDGEFKDLDEEIYFMCSTEICSPRDGPCVEGCFGR